MHPVMLDHSLAFRAQVSICLCGKERGCCKIRQPAADSKTGGKQQDGGLGLFRSCSTTCLAGTEEGKEQEGLSARGPSGCSEQLKANATFLLVCSLGSGDSTCHLSWTRVAQLSAFKDSQHWKHSLSIIFSCWLALARHHQVHGMFVLPPPTLSSLPSLPDTVKPLGPGGPSGKAIAKSANLKTGGVGVGRRISLLSWELVNVFLCSGLRP